MKKDYVYEYGINIEYEFKTYKMVGKYYFDSKKWSLKKYNRKINNRKFKYFNTYSEWETHVKEILPKRIYNNRDMIRWLIGKKRRAQIYSDVVKTIQIPLYITLLQIINVFEKGRIIDLLSLILVLVLVMVLSIIALHDARVKESFFTDLINIAVAVNLSDNSNSGLDNYS